jgi:ribonuclease P protein subunit RPR2
MAEKAAVDGEPETADRYIEMAWKIKLKFRLKLKPEQKRLFCRKCLKFLAGDSGSFRTESKELVISCKNCGDVQRIPL